MFFQLTEGRIFRNGKYLENPFFTGDKEQVQTIEGDDTEEDKILNPESLGAPFIVTHNKGSVSPTITFHWTIACCLLLYRIYFVILSTIEIKLTELPFSSLESKSVLMSLCGSSTSRRASPASCRWTSPASAKTALLLTGPLMLAALLSTHSKYNIPTILTDRRFLF